jgi:DNA-binding transcriptional ArsR family regulator
MAQSKRDEFDARIVRLADFARAMSHPARVEILKVLAKQDGCICGELVDMLPLSQSTVSQHLKVLKDIGLICGEIEGPKVCYCLDRDAITYSTGELIGLLDMLTRNKKSK